MRYEFIVSNRYTTRGSEASSIASSAACGKEYIKPISRRCAFTCVDLATFNTMGRNKFLLSVKPAELECNVDH
uniref:Uncharacterized protein n=1 Tax=Trichogramma kaykai TaxID=54128 RepID=A0ABD2XBW4_9HYME